MILARRSRAYVFALTALAAAITTAPASFAQTGDATAPAPKKPGKKKKPKGNEAPPAEATPPPAEPTPAPEPAPAPAAATDATPAPEPATTHAADEDEDWREKPAQTYYFIGLKYQATVIPKFMINLFVDEGGTMVSHSGTIEFDIRRDGFSLIPSITYASYGFGDTLFLQKNQPASQANNYSDVNSGLSAIYVGADLLWSKEITKHLEFEYGAGFGLGVVFGTLTNDWVYANPNGALVGSNGQHYAPCQTTSDGGGICTAGAHQNSPDIKVNNYSEKNWLQGGSIPVVFPRIAFPEIGVRYKPIKELETRFTMGFSLTGFFFGISADYGFPPKGKTEPPK